MQLSVCFTDVYKERTGKECQRADGGTHVNKVKSIGRRRCIILLCESKTHFLTPRRARARATLPHSGSAWRLRYAHSDVWREPVHALLGRYSYRAVYIWIRNCSTRRLAFDSINGADTLVMQCLVRLLCSGPGFPVLYLRR